MDLFKVISGEMKNYDQQMSSQVQSQKKVYWVLPIVNSDQDLLISITIVFKLGTVKVEHDVEH